MELSDVDNVESLNVTKGLRVASGFIRGYEKSGEGGFYKLYGLNSSETEYVKSTLSSFGIPPTLQTNAPTSSPIITGRGVTAGKREIKLTQKPNGQYHWE